MSDVHLHIPESLHRQLEERAQRNGVSLEELILDSLLRAVTIPDVAEQKAVFEEMRSRYPRDQAEAALREILSARK